MDLKKHFFFIILGNFSVGFVAIYILGRMVENYKPLITIPVFMFGVITVRYLFFLEKKVGFDKRTSRLGKVSFFVAGFIGFMLILFN